MRRVHRHGAEPPLPEMPGPLLARMDCAGIGAMHPREGAPQAVRVAGHQDQMDMVGHQAPGPDLDAGGAAGAAEEIAIEHIVRIRKERLLAAVAPLGDMVRRIGNDDPGETGHARTLARRCVQVN